MNTGVNYMTRIKPNVIISIHHRHAENILSGKKTVELRKSLPRIMPGKVYLYDTKEKKIIGYFVPKHTERIRFFEANCWDIHRGKPMWEFAAISKEEFCDYYFEGDVFYYEIDFALRFKNPVPLPLGIRAPQNFIYCGELGVE